MDLSYLSVFWDPIDHADKITTMNSINSLLKLKKNNNTLGLARELL